jgi:hypothetical protein
MSFNVETGIRHGCTPVTVSQSLRDQARFPRLLVYYIEKNQHDLVRSTIRTIKSKGLPVDSQIAALIKQFERGENAAGCEEMSFQFQD